MSTLNPHEHDGPCATFQMALSAAFDGEKTAGDFAHPSALDGHGNSCDDCKAFRQILECLHQPLLKSRDMPIPSTLRDRLNSIPLTRKPGPTLLEQMMKTLTESGIFQPAIAMLLLVALVGAALSLRNFGNQTPPILKHSQKAAMNANLLTLQATGEAAFSLPSSGNLRLWGGPAELTLDEFSGNNVALTMKSGRVCCNWEARGSVPFRLAFGASQLEIVGTTWRLSLEPTGNAQLEVAEGKVRVSPVGKLVGKPVGKPVGTLVAKSIDVSGLQKVRISAAGEVSPPEAFNPFVDPQLGIPPSQIWIGER